MKKVTERNSLAMIADDAIEQIQCARHHGRWLSALMASIRDTLTSSGPACLEVRVSRAEDLASLGQYLADDMTGFLSDQEDALQQQLTAAEAKE